MSELMHHGIDGQKWGVKHGPPYPLQEHSAREIKAARKSQKKANKKANKGIRGEEYRKAHTIPAGTKIYRTSADPNEETDGLKYVSYLDSDRQTYKGGWIRQTSGKDMVYEHEYVLKDDLNVPSRDELKNTINAVVRSDRKLMMKTVNDWLDLVYPKGSDNRYYLQLYEDKNGNEKEKAWKTVVNEFSDTFKNMSPEEGYFFAAQTMGINKDLKNKVVNELKKKGYNAMVDEAGVGGQNGFKREAIDPLIVFDGNILERKNTSAIGREEEQKARQKADKWRAKAEKHATAAWSSI